MLELNRSELRVLVGFLTEDGLLGEYMTRIALKHNSDCKFCGAEDDYLKHLISNCTAIVTIRASYFYKAVPENITAFTVS